MLDELTEYFGLPLRIVSDRGTAYTSKAFAEFCESYNIQHIQTAVRTPRANGQIERINGMMSTYLRTETEDRRKWDQNLKKFQWIINSQPNKTSGCCPNEIIFTYRLRDKLQNELVAALRDETDEEVFSTPDHTDVVERIDKEEGKWKKRYDSRHKLPRRYEENDLVVIECDILYRWIKEVRAEVQGTVRGDQSTRQGSVPDK